MNYSLEYLEKLSINNIEEFNNIILKNSTNRNNELIYISLSLNKYEFIQKIIDKNKCDLTMNYNWFLDLIFQQKKYEALIKIKNIGFNQKIAINASLSLIQKQDFKNLIIFFNTINKIENINNITQELIRYMNKDIFLNKETITAAVNVINDYHNNLLKEKLNNELSDELNKSTNKLKRKI